ncbi:hypothetical protein [Kitasatospora sp. NPDC093806]|uniref:hypothetical protein n=1 Tax=Kitasatospora sp. NPDC093806 TaxID=3155075 RepID=UPI0034149AE2
MSTPGAAPHRTAWPFAIVCTPSGFGVAAAPATLVTLRKTGLIGGAVVGEPGDCAYLRELTGSDGVSLWLLYRVVALQAAEVGQPGETARSGSRAAPLAEGVVLRERPAGAPSAAYFDAVHERVRDAVREYFLADDLRRPARPIPGAADRAAEGEPLRLVVQDRMTRGEPLPVVDDERFPAGPNVPPDPGFARPVEPSGDDGTPAGLGRSDPGQHRPVPGPGRTDPDHAGPAADPARRLPAGFGVPALAAIAVLSLLVVLLSVLLALK